MLRVRVLLDRMARPWIDRVWQPEWNPTVEEYRAMDRTLSMMEVVKCRS